MVSLDIGAFGVALLATAAGSATIAPYTVPVSGFMGIVLVGGAASSLEYDAKYGLDATPQGAFQAAGPGAVEVLEIAVQFFEATL